MTSMGGGVTVILLAAGASSRMAPRDKLTETVAGEPLLRRSARVALAAGLPVVAVLPPDRPARAAALDGLDLRRVLAADADRGMTASLRAGLAVLPDEVAGAMVLPADMPGFTADDLRALVARFEQDTSRIVRGVTPDRTPGHPALFPADLFPALMALHGDEGGRAVIRAHPARVVTVALPGDRAVLDLDTPEDWAAFRAAGNPA